MMDHTASCPICIATAHQFPLVGIEQMPVFCNVLWPDVESAVKAPLGQIRLMYCETCGHVYNAAFDSIKVDYQSNYENSLHYSPTFQDYAESTAQRLVDRYGLTEKTIVEIGCGKGDFLDLLCRKGRNRGLGFDPSYEEDRIPSKERSLFRVVRDYYSEKYSTLDVDMIVCRHVLEHIASPREFLKSVHAATARRPETVLFFEVPNVIFTLKDHGIWDLIYEHCGYFSTASLVNLFEATGFHPVSLMTVFGNQFICMEAFPAPNPSYPQRLVRDDLYEITRYARTFAHHYQKIIVQWKEKIIEMQKHGGKVVIWGAGSKGITFANVLKHDVDIDYIVDINPHKQGLFVPGTGQQVIGPDRLSDIQPSAVIGMNPVYYKEIEEMLRRQHLSCLLMMVH